jgi:hypothetical protein
MDTHGLEIRNGYSEKGFSVSDAIEAENGGICLASYRFFLDSRLALLCQSLEQTWTKLAIIFLDTVGLLLVYMALCTVYTSVFLHMLPATDFWGWVFYP